MLKSLTQDELQNYKQEGLLFPKRLISEAAAGSYKARWEAHERKTKSPISGAHRYKAHLLFSFVDEIMREPSILDVVEDILGPNIMVWNTNLYPKEPGDGRFISWHQDSAHWGLDNNNIVTVWVALAKTSRENGCMGMIPGSHLSGTVAHEDTWNPENILTRGQTISRSIDEKEVVWVELEAGECSLHHVEMMHSSPPNTSPYRRVALAIRYITPSAKQKHHNVDYATLVRGVDEFQNFLEEQRPIFDMSPDSIAFHTKVAESQGKILLHGTNRAGTEGLAETNSSFTS
tara:strand:- start:179 stop:1045 length:867 start_codon:yes stop_codon:yes gene_type:complete